jgi:Abortive infection C-terminus
VRAEGWELDPDGSLRPLFLENLEGRDLDRALRAYVRRAQVGATDAALVTGTGKDLLEATARRVLDNAGDGYPGHDFPGTLYHAFCAVGLVPPSPATVAAVQRELSDDARTRLVEVLFILGCVVNTLRNQQGTGHGRPFPAEVTEIESRAAVAAMGLISDLLLAATRN